MSKPKAVVLDGYTTNPGDNPWTLLETVTDLRVHDRTRPEEVVERSKDAVILLTNKTPVSAEAMASLPDLRLIAVLATGHNIVDGAAARARGIDVVNVPSYSTESVAQLTFALLLELCLHCGEHNRAVQEGAWQRHPDFSFQLSPLLELDGKTLGIAGYGRIGRSVARIAEAFGMKVQFFSRHQGSGNDHPSATFVPWETWLETSDVLSLHCALTPENTGMINADALARVRPHTLLINTSRGALIDEPALRHALETGQLAGAGLDVLSQEPPRENPLIGAPRCIITPHIGWSTLPARQRLLEATHENIAAFLEGSPINVVN